MTKKRFKMKKFTLLLLVLSGAVLAQDITIPVQDADSEPDNKKATKEEGGILSSMIMMYSTVRNAVKYTYDQIQFMRGIGNTVTDIGDWFKDTKERTRRLGKCFHDLGTEPGDWMMKLEKVEEIFDRIDDLALNQTAKLDLLVAQGEHYFDTLHTNPYVDSKGLMHRPMITPPTQLVSNQLTEWSEQVPWESIGKTEASVRREQLEKQNVADVDGAMHEEQMRLGLYADMESKGEDAEENLVLISKELASHVKGNSMAFEKWSQQGLNNVNQLDKEFQEAGTEGINKTELQTSWWMIEQVNAQNKGILHSELELKALLGVLGIDLFESTQLQTQRTALRINARQLAGYGGGNDMYAAGMTYDELKRYLGEPSTSDDPVEIRERLNVFEEAKKVFTEPSEKRYIDYKIFDEKNKLTRAEKLAG